MKKILFLLLCLGLAGCATIPYQKMPPNSYYRDIHGESWYKDYEIEIISDPPGAKIEWDNEYMGETPCKIIFKGRWLGIKPIIVIAYPTQPGQYSQIKALNRNPLPRKIYFNMYLKPISP
jgi:hypothetical protein